MSPLQALRVRFAALSVLGVFFSALAASPAAQASSSEIADLVNHMRTGPSRCTNRPGLQHFVRRPELDRAAAMVVGGAPLQESVRAAGYQAVAVKGISMSGSTDTRALETLLANGYCPYIVDPGMAEMGVHQQGSTTWVLLAGEFAPARGHDEVSLATRMLVLVNETRAQGRHCGSHYFPAARPVVWNEPLARAARAHSEDMARNSYFSHTSRDGRSPSDRVERAGYNFRGTAENIAAGQMTPEAVMAGWVSSPGHCANLMDAGYTDMGVALASNRQSQMGAYWTQEFGSPMKARSARPSRARPTGA
jgi:uncharacterized protein YkwD